MKHHITTIVSLAAAAFTLAACGSDGGFNPATGTLDGCFVPHRPDPVECPDGGAWLEFPPGFNGRCVAPSKDGARPEMHGLYREYFRDNIVLEQMYRWGKRHGHHVTWDEATGAWLAVRCWQNDALVWEVEHAPEDADAAFDEAICRPCP